MLPNHYIVTREWSKVLIKAQISGPRIPSIFVRKINQPFIPRSSAQSQRRTHPSCIIDDKRLDRSRDRRKAFQAQSSSNYDSCNPFPAFLSNWFIIVQGTRPLALHDQNCALGKGTKYYVIIQTSHLAVMWLELITARTYKLVDTCPLTIATGATSYSSIIPTLLSSSPVHWPDRKHHN